MAGCSPRAGFYPFALFAVFLAVLAGCNPQPPSALGPGSGSVTPVNVALLVPSESGDRRQDMLAESLVQAAQLAIAELGDSAQIDLRVYPTAGNPETAVHAVRQAAEDNADIVLGPLFSNTTTAVSQEAALYGLKVLSFSNNPGVAGGNVYVLGISFQNTASQLIAHAARQGMSRIAVVAAQNQAGRLATGAVETAAVINGASVVSVATYERSATGAIDAMPIIRRTVAESLPDAVVIDADSAGALPIFAEMLPDPGTDEVTIPEDIQYIGLTRWDVPKATLRHDGLQGGMVCAPGSRPVQRVCRALPQFLRETAAYSRGARVRRHPAYRDTCTIICLRPAVSATTDPNRGFHRRQWLISPAHGWNRRAPSRDRRGSRRVDRSH